MKTLKALLYSMATVIILPTLAFGSDSTQLGGEIEADSKLDMVTNYLTGEILVGVGILFTAVAGFAIMKSKANDNRGWEWLGRIAVGLVVATAAGGIIDVLFGSATI